jgi:hypothetical protein
VREQHLLPPYVPRRPQETVLFGLVRKYVQDVFGAGATIATAEARALVVTREGDEAGAVRSVLGV